MVKVLFVCLGNICRSPMAEGIFREIVAQKGYTGQISCDSAATSDYHIGSDPDERAEKTCSLHGISLNHKGKQLKKAHFDEFDYIIAMDSSNFNNIKSLGPIPEGCRVLMMRDFDPEKNSIDVPDPYYGGMSGFEEVYKMLWRSGERFLSFLIKEHQL